MDVILELAISQGPSFDTLIDWLYPKFMNVVCNYLAFVFPVLATVPDLSSTDSVVTHNIDQVTLSVMSHVLFFLASFDVVKKPWIDIFASFPYSITWFVAAENGKTRICWTNVRARGAFGTMDEWIQLLQISPPLTYWAKNTLHISVHTTIDDCVFSISSFKRSCFAECIHRPFQWWLCSRGTFQCRGANGIKRTHLSRMPYVRDDRWNQINVMQLLSF